MPIQAHSKAIWRESPNSGSVVDAVPMFLRYSGSDVVFTADRPEQLAFYLLGGNAILVDVAAKYIAASGADLAVNLVGPSIALLADDGAGGLEVTTNLTRPPAADLLKDAAGNLWTVPRTADRLDAVLIGGHIQLY